MNKKQINYKRNTKKNVSSSDLHVDMFEQHMNIHEGFGLYLII